MLLDVRNLRKRFSRRVVVNDVSLNVDCGEIVGLLGPNGGGKTTLFSAIIGLLVPDQGEILLDGASLLRKPVHLRCRMGIGYLSQKPSVFPSLSVGENLEMVLEIQGGHTRQERRRRVAAILERFGIGGLSSQPAGTLSGGEQRKLEIARILLLDCKLLLLDEPFSGVDPLTSDEIAARIREMKQSGMAVLLTDHNLGYSLPLTERSYILVEGSILAHGPPEALGRDPIVRARYLGTRFSP